MKKGSSDTEGTEKKRAYEKPMLKPIKLHAGEVLGVGCKTTVSQGPMFTPCIIGYFALGS